MNTLSKNQLIGVGVLLIILVAGGWLLLRREQSIPRQMQQAAEKTGTFATDVKGLAEAQTSQIVELNNGDTYDLEASIVRKDINGQPVKMLAYNGSIPGPLIKVKKDAEVTINFTNNTDIETTIHSHGVRLANAFDGTPDLTQEAISVGGTFTYKIKFPDAGMFWYHPHIREDYAQELGLYGNYLVVSDDPNYWQPVNQEVPLTLDDILLENGNIVSFDKSVADHTLMGRFGNTMLINGETNYKLNAKQGAVTRFYMTNTASTRTFNVTIPNAKIKLVGADSGKYERETFVDSVIISPSERVILDVLFDTAGAYALQHKTPEKTYTLGTITVASEKVALSYVTQFNVLRANQDIIASIDPFRSAFAKVPDKELTLTIDMTPLRQGSAGQVGMGNMNTDGMGGMDHGGHMMPDGSMMGDMMTPLRQGSAGQVGGSDDPIEWEDDMAMMNQMSTTENIQWKITDEATSKTNMDIDWKFKVGDKVKVSIFNDPKSMHPMQHPIHFHGQRFLVLSKNGVKNNTLAWKDTVLVGSGETIEVLVDMSNPGTWMAHCHIAEHLEDGMMFSYKVNP